jgi:pantothenate synthetase
VIFRALSAAEHLVKSGVKEPEQVKNKVQAVLQEQKSLDIDYIHIVDPETLAPLTNILYSMVILVAVRLGNTRLIDNMQILR